MAAVATYTKAGNKATTAAKLDKTVFGVEVKDHQLLKDAYLSYLANGRTNNAVTKKRGEVRGGGRKPWRQKGTGNARFGSSRNPIWRSGGVAFGPTGSENYSRRLNTSAKRQALRQALSMASQENRISVIESFSTDGKTKSAVSLLTKIDSPKSTLLVLANLSDNVSRSTSNIDGLKVVQATYLNVYDVANADMIVFEQAALDEIYKWLKRDK